VFVLLIAEFLTIGSMDGLFDFTLKCEEKKKQFFCLSTIILNV